MAHNPRLDIYKIHLRPTDNDQDKTFKDLIISKLFGEIDDTTDLPDDRTLFQNLLSVFIKDIDDEDFIVDERNFKAITAYDTDEEDNPTITINSSQNVISGVIEGGRYGQKRGKSSIGAKSRKEDVHTGDVILDQYFFLLYLPFDHNKGVLMIQSYSQDHIRDSLKSFLRNFFNTRGFYRIKLETYFPEQIKEEFRSSSAIKSIAFRKNFLLSAPSHNPVGEETEEFVIKIEATSATNHRFGLNSVGRLLSMFRNTEFGNENGHSNLNEFTTRIYLENSDSKKGAYFDISQELDIRPTIYLEDRIELDSDGIPDFNELKVFCFSVLENVKNEIRLANEIIER